MKRSPVIHLGLGAALRGLLATAGCTKKADAETHVEGAVSAA